MPSFFCINICSLVYPSFTSFPPPSSSAFPLPALLTFPFSLTHSFSSTPFATLHVLLPSPHFSWAACKGQLVAVVTLVVSEWDLFCSFLRPSNHCILQVPLGCERGEDKHMFPSTRTDPGSVVQGSSEGELQLSFFFRETLRLPSLPNEALKVQEGPELSFWDQILT